MNDAADPRLASTQLLLDLTDRLAARTGRGEELLEEATRIVVPALGDAAVLWERHPETGTMVPTTWYDAAADGTRPLGDSLPDGLPDRLRQAVGDGLVDEAWASGRPVLVAGSDPAEAEGGVEATYRPDAGSVAVVPLRLRGEVVGVLGLARRAGRPPMDEADQRVLLGVADRLAVALDNARRFQAAEAAAARHVVLVRAGDALARAALDLDEVVDAVVRTTADGLGDPCILRLLRDDDPGRFGRTAVHHPDPEGAALLRRHLASVSDDADSGLAGAVIRAGGCTPRC